MLFRYLAWAFDDGRFASTLNLIHDRLVSTALVHLDLFGDSAGLHGFFKEPQGCGLAALGRQQKVNRLAGLVHRAV